MKRLSAAVAGALLTMLIMAPAQAQQPAAPSDPHHPAAAPATPAPSATPGSKGGDMPMMDMCRQMMGESMAMPMMSGAGPADPKEKAEMLQMRGEMMKAMGDIMLKHAQRMQGGDEQVAPGGRGGHDERGTANASAVVAISVGDRSSGLPHHRRIFPGH